jgi:hypothetical protein
MSDTPKQDPDLALGPNSTQRSWVDQAKLPSSEEYQARKAKLLASPYTYAILQETSGEEYETWLYFIRYQGNEEALAHLQKQLEEVEWYIIDDLSTFDLELNYLVSELTAKEMTKVDLNSTSFHRKFDGKLAMINLGFSPRDRNKKKIVKAYRALSYGRISKYIDEEDLDPEDLISEEHAESGTRSDNGSEVSHEESHHSDSSSDKTESDKTGSDKTGSDKTDSESSDEENSDEKSGDESEENSNEDSNDESNNNSNEDSDEDSNDESDEESNSENESKNESKKGHKKDKEVPVPRSTQPPRIPIPRWAKAKKKHR